MSKGTNQKFKFTYLMQIMLEKTDDEHALTMPQIMEELEKHDVTAERKSIYTDFQDMTDKFGIEIIKEKVGRETYYHVGTREFELAEVKLLIDAITVRDYPMIQGTTLVIAALMITANIITDVVVAFTDPRIRVTGEN